LRSYLVPEGIFEREYRDAVHCSAVVWVAATRRYFTLLDATRRYSTLLDGTWRYLTLLNATRRYSTLLDSTRRYSILDATRRYSTLLDATRPYTTIYDATFSREYGIRCHYLKEWRQASKTVVLSSTIPSCSCSRRCKFSQSGAIYWVLWRLASLMALNWRRRCYLWADLNCTFSCFDYPDA
jgi:hypothetical protein